MGCGSGSLVPKTVAGWLKSPAGRRSRAVLFFERSAAPAQHDAADDQRQAGETART
jgi:hypothetical protein